MKRDIVVIGASAGGMEPLMSLTAGMDGNFQGSAFVVMHLWAESESNLPQILTRCGGLAARHPLDKEPISAGHIYVAPPDRHLVLEPGYIRLTRSPRHNRHRPSIDLLFKSAAAVFGPRVIGVLLSGGDDDGAAGLARIKACGGVALVQDPAEAAFPRMPESALHYITADYALPTVAIGARVAQLSGESVNGAPQTPQAQPKTVPASLSCPECDGPLSETRQDKITEYSCLVGHSFTSEGLILAEGEKVERALWAAVRVLEESAVISRKVANLVGGSIDTQARFESRAAGNEEHARIIRSLLESDT